ncbi:MAG: hypothetical protein ACLFNS_02200 [Desulfobacterales bacterium]
MNNLKLALGLAKRYRRCPPARIKNTIDHQTHFQKHLAICPFCQLDEPEDPADIEHLIEGLSHAVTPDEPASGLSDSSAGELRLIHPDCAQWRNGYYYNPPLILILESIQEIPGAVLAAQTYHDTTMAGPGDLILPAGQTNGLELFIEPWNIYTLSADYLGPIIGRVSGDTVEAVKRLDQNPEALPPWAIHPLPMLENDPRIYFRQLEVEVGYTFATSAANGLMSMHEAGAAALFNHPPDKLVSNIQHLDPRIDWYRTPESAGSAFLTLEFSPDKIRMAAADTEEIVCVANHIKLEQDRVVSVSPIYAQIKTDTKKNQSRTISGMIQSDAALAATELLAGWQAPSGKIHLPDRIEWEPGHHFFYLEFNHLPEDAGRLRMAIVQSS